MKEVEKEFSVDISSPQSLGGVDFALEKDNLLITEYYAIYRFKIKNESERQIIINFLQYIERAERL
jgi:hypothetical protein